MAVLDHIELSELPDALARRKRRMDARYSLGFSPAELSGASGASGASSADTQAVAEGYGADNLLNDAKDVGAATAAGAKVGGPWGALIAGIAAAGGKVVAGAAQDRANNTAYETQKEESDRQKALEKIRSRDEYRAYVRSMLGESKKNNLDWLKFRAGQYVGG
jgi:hypothetical protein